ncbi:MAG: elongation factor P [Candidatus Omnitrophica bacterium]|nr:elongation factor P [Candidatus Omnitrophota bacterium]
MVLYANELKRKQIVMVEGEPYQVVDVFIALPSARGASTMVRLRLRHFLNGSVQDKTFKAAEKFAEADVDSIDAHFLYRDNEFCYFMEQAMYETVSIAQALLGDAAMYLSENLAVKILRYQGTPVSLELPTYVLLEVAETEPPAQHAGSAGSGTKQATLANGCTVKVPQYVTAGDVVRVNTETGEFLGRA